jgi:hypothetical protein
MDINTNTNVDGTCADNIDSDMTSPFFGGAEEITKSYNGGTIKTVGFIKYFILTIMVIFVLYLIFRIFKQIRIEGEDYHQRKTHQYFNNIRGEEFDEEAKQALENGEAIENPRAIDHYRMGAVYLLNAQNPIRAHEHFTEALNNIINGQVDTREAPFILGRIDDFKDIFFDYPDVNDLPIQQAMLAHYNQQLQQIKHIEKAKEEIKEDDPEFKQKTLLSRQDWQSDSQNVHDSAIYKILKEQVDRVKEENAKVANLQCHGYEEAMNWLRARYRNNPAKLEDIEKVAKTLNSNYVVGHIDGLNEKDIITTVWQRSHDPENKDRAMQIREALGEAVSDCVERGSVVCMSGRTSKIWQALARLDKDEEIGVLKSKQAVRNEIYQKAAKIVDDYVGVNGSASQALKDAYNKNENSEQVNELKECMRKQIANLNDEYINIIPEQLSIIITECQAVV